MADKKDTREEQLAASRKAADEDTKAYYDRIDSTQPTPTQEENDRAKLGFESLKELDDKEADGSEEQRDLTADGAGAYSTRAAAPKK